MVLALGTALVLAFTPDAGKFEGLLLGEAAPAKLKLTVPELDGVALDKGKAEFFTGRLGAALVKAGLNVTTAEDIKALVSMERQRQLTGCSEKSSERCMTEIANAMGADGIVVGSVAKLDGSFAVNLKVIDAVDGTTLALFSAEANNEKGVLAVLDTAAGDIADQLQKLKAAPPVVVNPNAPANQVTPQKTPPKQTKYVTRPTAGRTFGKWAMIGSGVLLGISGGSAVLGLLLFGANVADVGGLLLIASLVELLLVPGVFLVGLVCYLVGGEETVRVSTLVLPGRENAPATAMVAFRF